jgi:predicted O-methyltransferase YrrM
MKRRGFTVEQIGYALRQAEGGVPTTEICRKLRVSEHRFAAHSKRSMSPRARSKSGDANTTKTDWRWQVKKCGEMPRHRLAASMKSEEYDRLRELLLQLQPEATLEIGMANGESSLVICQALENRSLSRHVAIDPFESSVWDGQGVKRIHEAGLSDRIELIEEFDYLALPRLVVEKRSFDFVLIDGWHSFDYAFIDLFYADLLLRPGGIVAIHDTGWPSVYKVCRFLETHKPYERLSPPPAVIIPSLFGRIARRIKQVLGGYSVYRASQRRRTEWFSLAVYRKREDYQVPSKFFVEF